MNSMKTISTTSFMQSYFSKKYLNLTRNAKFFTNWLLNKWFIKIAKKIEIFFFHDFENKCIKWFSKKKLMITNLCYYSNLSRYRCFFYEFVKKKNWNNKWIVFYNFWLLQKYEIYINVEICINAKFVKYLYKYIFKKKKRLRRRIFQYYYYSSNQRISYESSK